jgi:hypothetical protein
MNSRLVVAVLASLAVPSLLLGGCASAPARPAAHGAEPAVDAAIAPLGFMQGNWILSQPNGATIEEHWQAPRGKALLGSFRRVLGNGVTPFYEFTQIVAEQDRVVLRQIHVHGNFDTDPRRAEPMVLVMEKCSPSMATFVPAKDGANAGALARVTYSAPDRNTLLLVVEPRQEAGKPAEKPLEFRMRRSG